MDASFARPGDTCPICKSTTQSTPNLRFKVASGYCYHRICEGCVDRKFISGQAQCPVSTCKRQLWKRDWKFQTFENIQIEKERDIRREVYSRLDISRLGLPEDVSAFEGLRQFNDYLELKEEFSMNIVLDTDRKATLKKLNDFETANGLGSLTKDDPKMQKKRQMRDGEYPDASGLIKGLRQHHVLKPATPYLPFGDIPVGRDYYSLDQRETYETLVQEEHQHAKYLPWGYNFDAFLDENLLRAFSGLGVFVESEKGAALDMTVPLSATIK